MWSTVAVLVALGLTPVDAQRLTIYARAAGAVFGIPATQLIAVTGVESTYGLDRRRSPKGACGVMGVLGGRYGAPPCWAMEASTGLAVWAGAHRLAYFRRHCEGEPLCCYNRGWTDLDDCGYARKVRGKQRRLERTAKRREVAP